jgi:ABC-type transport system involved in multi-copper enzyme maturation permease subunit
MTFDKVIKMFTIAKYQILDGLLDAKLIFTALLVIVSFIVNGFVYSTEMEISKADWNKMVQENDRSLNIKSDNIADVAEYEQRLVSPPSNFSFIADDGSIPMPNSVTVNAFGTGDFQRNGRLFKKLPLAPAFDWVFIIGILMSIMTIIVGYRAICGEKSDGTLRLILSNPVSRLSLFFGKYLGLLFVVLIPLVVGSLTSLLIVVSFQGMQFTIEILTVYLWTILVAILYLSFVLLMTITISSATSKPTSSLVIAISLWVVFIVAVPGVSRLLAEQVVTLDSKFQIEKAIADKEIELWENAPDEAGSYNGDPFASFMSDRAEVINSINAAEQRIKDESESNKIRQIKTILAYSSISPAQMLANAIQRVCNTGIYRLEEMLDYSKLYQKSMNRFVVEADRLDLESAHHVYGSGGQEKGSYSTKEVEPSSIPRWQSIWGQEANSNFANEPWIQIVLLLFVNFNMCAFAILALLRYDPR